MCEPQSVSYQAFKREVRVDEENRRRPRASVQATILKCSIWPSQLVNGFQLVKIWATISKLLILKDRIRQPTSLIEPPNAVLGESLCTDASSLLQLELVAIEF